MQGARVPQRGITIGEALIRRLYLFSLKEQRYVGQYTTFNVTICGTVSRWRMTAAARRRMLKKRERTNGLLEEVPPLRAWRTVIWIPCQLPYQRMGTDSFCSISNRTGSDICVWQPRWTDLREVNFRKNADRQQRSWIFVFVRRERGFEPFYLDDRAVGRIFDQCLTIWRLESVPRIRNGTICNAECDARNSRWKEVLVRQWQNIKFSPVVIRSDAENSSVSHQWCAGRDPCHNSDSTRASYLYLLILHLQRSTLSAL